MTLKNIVIESLKQSPTNGKEYQNKLNEDSCEVERERDDYDLSLE